MKSVHDLRQALNLLSYWIQTDLQVSKTLTIVLYLIYLSLAHFVTYRDYNLYFELLTLVLSYH